MSDTGTPHPEQLGPTLYPGDTGHLIDTGDELVAMTLATATDFVAVIDAALALCGAWLEAPPYLKYAGETAALRERVAALLTALEATGFLDRGSRDDPAAMSRLSPRQTPGPSE